MWKSGLKWLIFLSLFLLVKSCPAEIRTVDQLIEIERELQGATPNDLVLLDVGGTLLTHQDAVLQPSCKIWKKSWYQKNFPDLTRQEKVEISFILQEAGENWCLVDQKWPSIVSEAQKKGIKIVALTKTTVDPALRGLRYGKLSANGIFFTNDLPELSDGETFIYGSGVIETEADFKGDVLKEALAKLDKKPERIIFVDNNRVQIESVEKACQELGIPSLSFEFTATQRPFTLDEKIADYQLYLLVTEHRWLSEDDVRQILDR